MIIKYLNLNIWMSLMWSKTLPFLKEQNPDVMVLQEVMHADGQILSQMHQTKNFLQENMGYKYSAYMPLAEDTRHKPPALFGNMTLSKFPILESKEIFFDRPFGKWDESVGNEDFPRGLLYTKLELSGGKILNVFNIHGIWGKKGGDTDRRLNMIDIVIKNIGSLQNVVLSGDFNLNENVYPPIKTPGTSEANFILQFDGNEKKDDKSIGFNRGVNPETEEKPDLTNPQRTQSVAKLEEKLTNVFKDERITSFNPKQKDFATTGYAYAVVDMVFVSPNIKVLSHTQPQADVSDHMPQIVEISL
jgi:endonuclease/exonuclease/phosphatase family metal-dependent hydrolase